MSPERFRQIQTLYLAALDRPSAARTAFLDEACPDDPDLRAEVDSLLAAETDGFLETPIAHVRELAPSADAVFADELRLGPYRVVEELGRGGMGTVYLAERTDGHFEQQVALKVVRHGLESDAVAQRFLLERQLLARLQHPHIARLYDGGMTDDGRPYFAMEYVEGTPITAYCDAQRLSIPARLRLFLDVCAAVQHAHQQLIVHRDLKPSNILVTADGSVKLLDFGIAKLLAEEAGARTGPQTETGLRLLTPEYAAPEQLLGEPVATATDVYALGVLLYTLMTGHRPYRFGRYTPGAIEQAILNQEPERPSTRVLRPETVVFADGTAETRMPDQVSQARAVRPHRLRQILAGDLDLIALQALRKEPSRRYASAEALAEDLRRTLAHLPITARPDSSRYRLRKFFQRHRGPVLAGLLITAALITGLGVALWQASLAAQERDNARLEAAKATAVKDFLVGIFRVSDPSESRGQSVTAQELLDAGAVRIETALRTQPAVQADLMGVMSEVYRQLGLYQEGEALATQSLRLYEQLALNADDQATALRRLALIRYDQGELDQALALLRRAVGLLMHTSDASPAALATAQHHLGVLLLEHGEFKQADSLLRAALTTRQEIGSEIERATTQASLGLLLMDQARYDEAEPLLRSALATQRRSLGPDHPSVGETMHGLAQLYWNRGDLDAAEPLFRSVLALSRKVYGATHSYVALDLNSLGLLLMDRGNLVEAEALYMEALVLQQEALGNAHPDLSATVYNLGSCYYLMERFDEAERYLRRALEIDTELFGSDHPNVAIDQTRLAAVLRARGRFDAARALLDDAEVTVRATYGEAHPRLADVQVVRAQLAFEERRFGEAAALLENALSTVEAQWASDSWKSAEARGYLGLSLMQIGRADEGHILLRRALPLLEQRLGATHRLSRTVRSTLDTSLQITLE